MKRCASLLVGLAALAAQGCGPADGEARQVSTQVRQPIAGGYDDLEDTAILGIVHVTSSTLCSGTLIAPNVVLTARHCVSPLSNSGVVVCDQTTVGALYGPSSFRLTANPDVIATTSFEFLVAEVVGAGQAGDSICGTDVAALILTDNVPADTAAPREPRLDVPLEVGEVYSAVGYGAIDGQGTDAGKRRRRDDLEVECIGSWCNDSEVAETEWGGSGGVCHGDSGGPALDGQGRVLGVASRATLECDASFYAGVIPWASWLQDTVVYASGMGGYEAPIWTAGSMVDPEHSMPIGQSCGDDGDCPSGRCLADDGELYCTRACNDVGPCPAGYECLPRDGVDVCVAQAPAPPPQFRRADQDGCALGGAPPPARGSPGLWVLVAGMVGLAGARRRSRSG